MCQKKIMRKRSHDNFDEETPRKKLSRDFVPPKQVVTGEVLTDLTGKQWKVGKVIGHGGFGEIYLASDNLEESVKNDAPYVVKIESHSNGPLFVEINCFLRTAKSQMVDEWIKQKNLDFLGMPHYIASGSHMIDEEKLRFLILPRYDQDLEKILNRHSNKFNLKTVINICVKIIDVLEYIHSKGFVHCDIKASNVLHSIVKECKNKVVHNINSKKSKPRRKLHHRNAKRNAVSSCIEIPLYMRKNLRSKKTINYNEDIDPLENCLEGDSEEDDLLDESQEKSKNRNTDKIYLMDYGLAMKYRLSNGQHRQYCNDERKAHAGTLLFCSLDAHLGAQSRRSDLECLGYNMIYWLTAKLPWEKYLENPEAIEKEKKINFQNLDKFLKNCFGADYPIFVYEYFHYIRKLSFEQKPDYNHCKKLLTSALEEYGYKKDCSLDFENLEGWGKKQKNKKLEISCHKNSPFIARQPLLSNSPIKKPVLRGTKMKKLKRLNWSKILSSDPEKILKNNRLTKEDIKPRDRRITDPSEPPIQHLDIVKLNPTLAMVEVFNKSRDRNGNYNNTPFKNGKGDSFVCDNREGYTHAMNMVLTRIKEQKLNEIATQNGQSNLRKCRSFRTNSKRTEIKKITSTYCIGKELKKSKSSMNLRRQGIRG